MRRRLLGHKHSSRNNTAKGAVDPPTPVPPQNMGVLEPSSRRSFSSAETTDYAAGILAAENKYATIGRVAKKWPSAGEGGGGIPSLPTPFGKKALNGCCTGERPRSMGAAQMGGGVNCSAAPLLPCAPPADANRRPNVSSAMKSPGAEAVPQVNSGSFFAASNGGNNRNSTGSTNSSQTSSGFESAKSSSSHQLAQSTSSGSCSSGIGSSVTTSAAVPPAPLSADPASPSSRLSSAGSSTQGRSSAYFSLSDGIDGGTLTVQKRAKGARGNCPRVNIAEMVAKGIPESEIFAEWLQRLCLSEYLALFLSQGYDLATLCRATPEDLTTLGITKPEDRKRLVQDIQCWRNLEDHWPTHFAPDANVRDWLGAVGLKQYVDQFEQQGYLSVGELEQLEAEDLEDIGVTKLGHIKRICLALKKLKQSRVASKPEVYVPYSSLRPCSLSSAPPSTMPTLRRHASQQQRVVTFGGEQPRVRETHCPSGNEKSVHFRNSSFAGPADRGPPRLNLYRTSQIIAQLPREPPPELDDEDEEECRVGGRISLGHIPPPPAPMPVLSPCHLPPPPAFFPSSTASLAFCHSLSQPTTPRNAQKLFPSPMDHDQQQQQRGRSQLEQILHDLETSTLAPKAGAVSATR